MTPCCPEGQRLEAASIAAKSAVITALTAFRAADHRTVAAEAAGLAATAVNAYAVADALCAHLATHATHGGA